MNTIDRRICVCLFLTGLSAAWGARIDPAPVDSARDTAIVQKPLTVLDKIRAKRLNIQLYPSKGDLAAQVLSRENEAFAGTDLGAKIDKVQRDKIGYTHVRMRQYYKGIPVDGAEKIAHINKDNVLYDIEGGFVRRLNVNVSPDVSAERAKEIALDDATATQCTNGQCSQWKEADEATLDEYAQLRGTVNDPLSLSREPALIVTGKTIAWIVKVRERGRDYADWEYWIDAHTGELCDKSNTIAYAAPDTAHGVYTSVTGVKLHRETNPTTNDSVVTVTGWRDTVGAKNYFLYFKGRPDSIYAPWGIYDQAAADWEQLSTSNWGTTDRAAISAGKNAELITRWLGDTLGLYGFDNAGKRAKIYIHKGVWHPGMEPSDTTFHFGDYMRDGGDTDTVAQDLVALEIIGHEVGHGMSLCIPGISATSYRIETGALCESYSDIIGAAIEFASQSDGTGAYPNSTRGKSDWLVGEDVMLGFAAHRDLKYLQRDTALGDTVYYDGPNARYGSHYATYYDGTYFWDGDIHTAGGVQNTVYYLVAAGNDQTRYNDGHAYGVFGGLGPAAAAQIAMHADLYHCNKYSDYHDAKQAWLKAAAELIDESKVPANSATIVDSAWCAVGVKPELRFRYLNSTPTRTKVKVGRIGNLKSYASPTNTAPAAGDLRFSRNGAWKTGVRSDGKLSYAGTTFSENQSAFLDGSSFTGGLVIRGPDGKAQFFADSTGNVKIREAKRVYAF